MGIATLSGRPINPHRLGGGNLHFQGKAFMSTSPETSPRAPHPARAGTGPRVQYVAALLSSAGLAAAFPVAVIGLATERFSLFLVGSVAFIAFYPARALLQPWGHVPEGALTDSGPVWRWGLIVLPGLAFAAAGVAGAALLPAEPWFMVLPLTGSVVATWKIWLTLADKALRRHDSTELADLFPGEDAEWKAQQVAVAGAALAWVALGAAMAPDVAFALAGAALGAAATLTGVLAWVVIVKGVRFIADQRSQHILT